MSVDDVEEHVMHEEYYSLSQETADLHKRLSEMDAVLLLWGRHLSDIGDGRTDN